MKGALVYAAIGKPSHMLSETFQHGCNRVFSHASARKVSFKVFKSNKLIGSPRVSFDGTVLWFVLRTIGEGQRFCPFLVLLGKLSSNFLVDVVSSVRTAASCMICRS